MIKKQIEGRSVRTQLQTSSHLIYSKPWATFVAQLLFLAFITHQDTLQAEIKHVFEPRASLVLDLHKPLKHVLEDFGTKT